MTHKLEEEAAAAKAHEYNQGAEVANFVMRMLANQTTYIQGAMLNVKTILDDAERLVGKIDEPMFEACRRDYKTAFDAVTFFRSTMTHFVGRLEQLAKDQAVRALEEAKKAGEAAKKAAADLAAKEKKK